MSELWIGAINYIIGLGAVFLTILFILLLGAILAKMLGADDDS